jgi:hypothetical protein
LIGKIWHFIFYTFSNFLTVERLKDKTKSKVQISTISGGIILRLFEKDDKKQRWNCQQNKTKQNKTKQRIYVYINSGCNLPIMISNYRKQGNGVNTSIVFVFGEYILFYYKLRPLSSIIRAIFSNYPGIRVFKMIEWDVNN